MNEWKPIETAPKDGTVVMLTDGTYFSSGSYSFWEESDYVFKEHPNGLYIMDPAGGIKKFPNPKAGKRTYYWSTNGLDTFANVEDADFFDDCENLKSFKPTHWMPMLEPPK